MEIKENSYIIISFYNVIFANIEMINYNKDFSFIDNFVGFNVFMINFRKVNEVDFIVNVVWFHLFFNLDFFFDCYCYNNIKIYY